jgi:hypothetical protein
MIIAVSAPVSSSLFRTLTITAQACAGSGSHIDALASIGRPTDRR